MATLWRRVHFYSGKKHKGMWRNWLFVIIFNIWNGEWHIREITCTHLKTSLNYLKIAEHQTFLKYSYGLMKSHAKQFSLPLSQKNKTKKKHRSWNFFSVSQKLSISTLFLFFNHFSYLKTKLRVTFEPGSCQSCLIIRK